MLASTIKRILLSFTFILVYSASSQAETITFNVTASGGAYSINGASRAELQLTVGNTYVFTGFPGFHPLRLSTTDNGSWGGGVNYQDNVTTTSTSITIVVTEDTPNLFYYCQNHSGMGAAITIASPSNGNVINYSVTAAGGAYFIDGVSRDQLNFTPGNTYVFDGFPSGHPLLLSATPDGTHNGGISYTDGVTVSANRLEIEVTEQTPALYYYCLYHPGMGASISIALAEENVPAMGLGGMLVMGLLLTAVVRRANRRIS